MDPTYEFEAPRYMEFGLPEETVGVVDEWFGELNIRPFYTPAYIQIENKAAEEFKVEELFTSNTDFAEASSASEPNGIKRPVPSSPSDKAERPRKRARAAKASQAQPKAFASSLKSSTSSKNDSMLGKTAINVSTWENKLTIPESPMLHTKR